MQTFSFETEQIKIIIVADSMQQAQQMLKQTIDKILKDNSQPLLKIPDKTPHTPYISITAVF